MNPALLSSARPDWNTPEEILSLVRQLGPIGLDPCSNPTSLVGARVAWSLETGDDGLAVPWRQALWPDYVGLVYVNPPYGREIEPWAAKCAAEAAPGCEIVALLPARTDAGWWQWHITTARAVCFWRGRLRFLGAESSAPFPSALAYWGARVGRFRAVFGPHGWIPGGRPSPSTPSAPTQAEQFSLFF
jgi:hypothetical protein